MSSEPGGMPSRVKRPSDPLDTGSRPGTVAVVVILAPATGAPVSASTTVPVTASPGARVRSRVASPAPTEISPAPTVPSAAAALTSSVPAGHPATMYTPAHVAWREPPPAVALYVCGTTRP